MPTPPRTDAALLEVLEVYERLGRSAHATTMETGKSRATVKRYIAEARQRGLHLSDGAQDAMRAVNLNGAEIAGGWRHAYDDEGKKVESVRWSAPKQEATEDVLDRIREAFEGITASTPVPAPQSVLADLCTVYPIADAHIGLMAWHRETGTDYDTSIACERVRNWVAQCVAASPPSGTAIILDVGDLFHADNDTYQTPRGKHVLDVDTRMFRTLDIGIATLAGAVESALTKHQTVHVRILPGNHDSTIYLAVMFALSERYRDDPRVIVHKEPSEFFLFEFGRVMLTAHHGDKAKADRLVHFVADEFAEAWGRTKYRFLFTGHLHSHKSQDIGGMKWEQLRAVAERDAYAVSHAYSGRAQLQAITYDKSRGEVQRVSVNA